MPSLLHRHALAIFRAGLAAADPVEAVRRHLKLGELRTAERIFVIGAGKASAAMVVGVERMLGRRITGGLINTKDGHLARLRRVELNECGHPVPDERGVAGARAHR